MSLEAATDTRPETDIHRSQGDFGDPVDFPPELDAHRNGLQGRLDVRAPDAGEGALGRGEAAQHAEAQPDAGVHLEHIGADIREADVRQQVDGGRGNPAASLRGIRPEVRTGQLHAHGEPVPELEGHFTRQEAHTMDLVALISGRIGGRRPRNGAIMRIQEIFRRHPRIEGIGERDFRLGIPVPKTLGIEGLHAQEQDQKKNESFHIAFYLYRKRRMLIFGVFSKGLSISSTLAIWL